MSQWITRALVCAALIAAAGVTGTEATAGDTYTVYIDYNGDGTNMNASWSSQADEDGSAILCFGDGAASVSICGNEPCEVKGGEWPCWEHDRYRYDPDFGAIVTLNIMPVQGNEVEITGRIHRTIRTDDGLYRMERDKFNRVETLGDRWTLSLGSGDDGTAYDLTVRVEGRARESWTIRRAYQFRLRYVLRDLSGGDGNEKILLQGRLKLASGSDETDRADFEAPVQVRGIDSSVLFTQVTLKDVSEGSGGRQSSLEATFAMERQLAMGVLPARGTGITSINGHMMMSSFQKAITLRPGRALRIRIPEQDGERDYIRTEEYIELEWDEDGGY